MHGTFFLDQEDFNKFLFNLYFSGDLWSFNYTYGDFIISPMPDVSVHNLLPKNDKCLILGSDGLWNMMTPLEAVMVVLEDEQKFDELVVNDIVSNF